MNSKVNFCRTKLKHWEKRKSYFEQYSDFNDTYYFQLYVFILENHSNSDIYKTKQYVQM